MRVLGETGRGVGSLVRNGTGLAESRFEQGRTRGRSRSGTGEGRMRERGDGKKRRCREKRRRSEAADADGHALDCGFWGLGDGESDVR